MLFFPQYMYMHINKLCCSLGNSQELKSKTTLICRNALNVKLKYILNFYPGVLQCCNIQILKPNSALQGWWYLSFQGSYYQLWLNMSHSHKLSLASLLECNGGPTSRLFSWLYWFMAVIHCRFVLTWVLMPFFTTESVPFIA